MKTIRIMDVAQKADVSVATVTRVINNTGYVSNKTRLKVQKTIESLGYIPNRMASALKSNHSNIIGNITPVPENNTYFANVCNSIARYAQQYSYSVLSMTTNSDASREHALINEMIGRMVDGIIFTGGSSAVPTNIKTIVDKDIPVIMIERPLDIAGVDKIFINDLEGSALAAERFLSFGHENIGIIGIRRNVAGYEMVESNRFEGFSRKIESTGISIPEKNVVEVEDYQVEYGYAAMRELLARHTEKTRPTACFILSDILACGALQYLYCAGIRVPDEMSIIGYDNTLSSLCTPAISSIAFPIDDIGKTAIDMFIERKEDQRNYGKSVTLSPFYKDRNTVAKPVTFG